MKSKLKIIIPIAIAVTAIILAVIFIQFKPNEVQLSDNPFELAQNYLVEQSYEQAIAEFEKAIALDPMNVEAYIGIAEAYEAIGNKDMAVQWLEKGLEATGDERIKEKLDEILSGDVEAAEVVTTITEETTTTKATTTVPETTTTVTTTEATITAPVEEFITIKGEKYSTLETSLNLQLKDLTDDDIKALNNMTNLTKLYLNGNNISDITPLSNLTNLTELYLNDNNISDIAPLSGLTNLTELSLTGNNISDISPLNDLINLTKLKLSITNNDISYLSNLINLTELYLGGNDISDISPLRNLTNLTELSLNSSNISNVRHLSGLTNLTELNLSRGKINKSDIKWLEEQLPNCDVVWGIVFGILEN